MEIDKEVKKDVNLTFLLEVLTDMESLKSLIYNGSDVAAYRSLQKISDKIRQRIMEKGIKNAEENRQDSQKLCGESKE